MELQFIRKLLPDLDTRGPERALSNVVNPIWGYHGVTTRGWRGGGSGN